VHHRASGHNLYVQLPASQEHYTRCTSTAARVTSFQSVQINETGSRNMTSIDYLDRVKERYGVTDYGAAPMIGITRAQVSSVRTGRSGFGERPALQIAKLLDLKPHQVLADLMAEKAPNAEIKQVRRVRLRPVPDRHNRRPQHTCRPTRPSYNSARFILCKMDCAFLQVRIPPDSAHNFQRYFAPYIEVQL
jgi:plasmid maintenance system antidote protein VapI